MIWILALSLWAYDASGDLVAYCDDVEIRVASDKAEVREVSGCQNVGGGTEPPVEPPVDPEPAEGNLCFDGAAANAWDCLACEGHAEGTGVTGSNVIAQQATVRIAPNRTHVYAMPAGPDSNTSGSFAIVQHSDISYKSWVMSETPETAVGNQPRGKCEGWGSTGDMRWRIDAGGGCSELGHSSGFVYWSIASSTPGHGGEYKLQCSAGQ